MDEMPYPDEFFDAAEKQEKIDRTLRRYNEFYNLECASLPSGGPISMMDLQSITLECMIASLRCENLNQEYTHIAIEDIENLIEGLYQQGKDYLGRVKEND